MSTAGSVLTQTKLADVPSFNPYQDHLPALAPGALLLGRFQLMEEIGSGGMGRVYAAWDSLRSSHVAIKVLTQAMMGHEAAQRRFMSEAEISLQLSHPNIVRVFDIQRDEQGMTFIVMELLSGYSLRQWIEYYRSNSSRFEFEEVKRIGMSVCDALTVAHQVTVHRDIKPENIFIIGDGTVKLMDFGIARDVNQSQLTHTSMAIGTAYYMAPEQMSASRSVDGRADLYALGVVLYEMLTGTVPTGMAHGVQTLRTDVPPKLARAVEKALAPLPEMRYASAAEFKEALATGRIAGESWWTTHGKMATAAAGVVGALVIAAAAVAMLGQGTSGLAGMLGDHMPLFGEAAEQMQKQVSLLDAQVKDMRKQLEGIRSNAARDGSPAYATVVGDKLLASAEWAKLESGAQLAADAMRDKSYRKAVRLLEQARIEHEAKLAAVKAVKPALGQIDGVRALAKSTNTAVAPEAQRAISTLEGGEPFVRLANPDTEADAKKELKDIEDTLSGERRRLAGVQTRQQDDARQAQQARERERLAQEAQRRDEEARRRQEEARQRELALEQQRRRDAEMAEQQRRRDAELSAQRQREQDAANQRRRDDEARIQRQRDEEARARRQRDEELRQRRQEEQEAREARKQEACRAATVELTGLTLGSVMCARRNNCVPDLQKRIDAQQRKVNESC